MHTMWKGSISFGLVNIPVKMFAATEDKDIRFRNIHKECHTPVKYQQVCPHCDKKVSPDEIVRGYEYEPGRFVIIEDHDLDAIKPDITKSIEITDFVLLKDIHPILFRESNHLQSLYRVRLWVPWAESIPMYIIRSIFIVLRDS